MQINRLDLKTDLMFTRYEAEVKGRTTYRTESAPGSKPNLRISA